MILLTKTVGHILKKPRNLVNSLVLNPKCRLQAMRQRDEELAREVELLKSKLQEIEQLAQKRGLAGVFNFRHAHTDESKPAIS